MTTPFKSAARALIICASLFLAGCYVEDPGPRQAADRAYPVVDFDRLEIGSGLHITVERGDFYAVSAAGDRRNIEDLIVEKEGSTLVIRYRNFRERRHDTYIDITMPGLAAVTFSGGSDSRVSGFTSDNSLDVHLSGSSVCQLGVSVPEMSVVLSGGSYLNLRGEGALLQADISGASVLKAFNFPVTHSDISVSGASHAEVAVSEALDVTATGASHLVYRGAPTVSSEVSGASSVHQE